MKHDYDVVVVGGGPCGSFSALQAAKKGVSVAVFEEHREVGIPVHCPGHISIKGLRQIGLYPLPNKVIENVFYGARFYSPKGVEFSIRFHSPVTCTVNREFFDKYLKKLAENFGTQYYLKSRVKSVITAENSRVKGVKVQYNSKDAEVYSKMVIDAEGISARLTREAGLKLPRETRLLKAVHAEIENVKDIEDDAVEVYLGNAYAPGFYCWIIPKKDGKAKVGLAVREGDPRDFLKKLMLKHPEASLKLKKSKIVYKHFHSISLGGPIPKTFSNGFLVVGDAASQVKPTTGGGIIIGLNCAKIAAEVAVEALNKGDISENYLSQYQKRVSKLMGFDMKTMLIIRKIMDRMADKKIDSIAHFYEKMRMNEAVKNIKEIDFQGKAMINAIKDPRILAFLTYSFITCILP
ncbi:NAD(P)/FAD-dependent oxidoreductase [Candidatus Bathyarchaeota archaeon]|nr:NAD(P)/FAD-dependent oxidoreductase [Candidatus Bathyarchaeota archaeon]